MLPILPAPGWLRLRLSLSLRTGDPRNDARVSAAAALPLLCSGDVAASGLRARPDPPATDPRPVPGPDSLSESGGLPALSLLPGRCPPRAVTGIPSGENAPPLLDAGEGTAVAASSGPDQRLKSMSSWHCSGSRSSESSAGSSRSSNSAADGSACGPWLQCAAPPQPTLRPPVPSGERLRRFGVGRQSGSNMPPPGEPSTEHGVEMANRKGAGYIAPERLCLLFLRIAFPELPLVRFRK